MSILVGRETRVVVQGITGREGTFHALRCKEYGTRIVGGVTPGKGGTTHEGFPVWNTVAEAVSKEGATCALIFVPPAGAADAIMEAAAAGGGTKISAQSAPEAATASSTVFQTAKPSWVAPPLPGVTPPTTVVPYSFERAA